MKTIKRILIPLLISALVLSLLILAGCRTKAPVETETDTAEAETGDQYEFLTGVELQTGETPVLLLPDNETTQTFTATGDGSTATVDLSNQGNPPSEVTEVKIDGQVVPETEYNYDPDTGKLEFETPPDKDAEIEIEAKVPDEPPETTEPPASSEPATSTTPAWSGPPETPIIPYHPNNDSDG